MSRNPPKEIAHLTIRMNRDLLEEMRLAAARDQRSLNNFVTTSLRRQLQQLIPDQPRKRGKDR